MSYTHTRKPYTSRQTTSRRSSRGQHLEDEHSTAVDYDSERRNAPLPKPGRTRSWEKEKREEFKRPFGSDPMPMNNRPIRGAPMGIYRPAHPKISPGAEEHDQRGFQKRDAFHSMEPHPERLSKLRTVAKSEEESHERFKEKKRIKASAFMANQTAARELGGKELSPVDKDRMMAEKEKELKREERLKKQKMKEKREEYQAAQKKKEDDKIAVKKKLAREQAEQLKEKRRLEEEHQKEMSLSRQDEMRQARLKYFTGSSS